jgi:hypothetical protein
VEKLFTRIFFFLAFEDLHIITNVLWSILIASKIPNGHIWMQLIEMRWMGLQYVQ